MLLIVLYCFTIKDKMQTMKHERFTKLNARFYVFFNFLDCDSEMHTKVYFNHAGILFPIHRQSEIKYWLNTQKNN